MEVAELLNAFYLDHVQSNWFCKFWDSDFEDIEDIPSDYEEFIHSNVVDEIINSACNNIKYWFERSEKDPSVVSPCWKELLDDYNVKLKPSLCVIGYVLTYCQTMWNDENARARSLAAARLYFLLLTIQGSSAFQVFNSCLFSKALATFELSKHIGFRHKTVGKVSANAVSSDTNSNIHLSAPERKTLIIQLNTLLHTLLKTINTFSMLVDINALAEMIQQLTNMTRIETHTLSFENDSSSFRDDSNSLLSFNAFKGLKMLCKPEHGNVQKTVQLIMKGLLPTALQSGAYGFDASTNELSAMRSSAVHFINDILINVGEQSYKGVRVLFHHVCYKIPDRAESRQKGAQFIVEILKISPPDLLEDLIKWLFEFAYEEQSHNRLFAVEVIFKLFNEGLNPNDSPTNSLSPVPSNVAEPSSSPLPSRLSQVVEENEMEQEGDAESQNDGMSLERFMLGILINRCRDIAGKVRAKALETLAESTKTNNLSMRKLLNEIFVSPYEGVAATNELGISNYYSVDYLHLIKHINKSNSIIPLPTGEEILSIVEDLILDETVIVRKSALQVLENIMKMNVNLMNEHLLKIFCQSCKDPSLLVRKHAIQSLTLLLCEYPEHDMLAQIWTRNVVPQIGDPEISVQEKVLESLQTTMLNNITDSKLTLSPMAKLPWKVLTCILKMKLVKYLDSAFIALSKKKALQQSLLSNVKTHIGTCNSVQAWIVVSNLAKVSNITHLDFVIDYYQKNVYSQNSETVHTLVMAVEVLRFSWTHLTHVQKKYIIEDMTQRLNNFDICIELIGPMMELFFVILKRGDSSIVDSSEIEDDNQTNTFLEDLVKKSSTHLESSLEIQIMNSNDFEKCIRQVLTFGEAVMLCPRILKEETFNILFDWTFCNKNDLENSIYEKRVQRLQSIGVVSLGKINLVEEHCAKKVIPAMVQLLHSTKNSSIKENIICSLTDMHIRYGGLMQPYLPHMIICLKDKDVLVKERTLTSFIQLLQEDYLKPKGPLFFYILSMICDPDKKVQSIVKNYFSQTLLPKQSNIMYINLPECLFYFNKCKDYKDYGQFSNPLTDKFFNLSGSENKQHRRKLYCYMLENMDDVQRLEITSKLCDDILNGVNEGKVSIEGTGQDLLSDTLYALSCEEIRLNCTKVQSNEDCDEPEANVAIATISALRKGFSNVLKKAKVEHIVPIVLRMKKLLEDKHSPLVSDILEFLRILLHDFKNEMQDILSNDFVTKTQVLAAINKHELEEKRKKT